MSCVYHIVICGNTKSGKTSLVECLNGNGLVTPASTIGGSLSEYKFNINNTNVTLKIHDIQGKEQFRSITKNFIEQKDGALLVSSLAEPFSRDNLESWLNALQTYAKPKCPILCVGTKADKKKTDSENDFRSFAYKHRLDYIETSSHNSENVRGAFFQLAEMIQEKYRQGILHPDLSVTTPLLDYPTSRNESKGCCNII